MVEVRYFSRSGNTKAIGEAIAKQAGVQAKGADAPLDGRTELLFLGGALYAGGIAGKLKKLIKTLSPDLVQAVAVFSTTANPNGAYDKIKKAFLKQGLNVLSKEFHCVGAEAKGEEAAKRAAEFAKEMLETGK